MVVENKASVESFVNSYLSSAHDFCLAHYDSHKYSDGEMKKHAMKDMRVGDVMPLVGEYISGNYSDAITKAMIIRYLTFLAENEKDSIKVIFMSKNKIRERSKTDEVDGIWSIPLFQGRSNLSERDNYIGDANIFDSDVVTVQIHHVRILGLSVEDASRSETYAIAIHVPQKLAAHYCITT